MKLFAILKFDFEGTDKRLADGSMINLNDVKPGERIRSLLKTGYYFDDPKDINLAAQYVTQGFVNSQEPIENIGALNKRQFNVPSEIAFAQGGESYKKRALLSRALIGFVGDDSLRFEQEKVAPPPLSPTASAGLGSMAISGKVFVEDEKPASGVLVRLQMIFPSDSLYSSDITEVDSILIEKTASRKQTHIIESPGHRQIQSMRPYARTDGGGNFSLG
jgi:hypothetical protein